MILSTIIYHTKPYYYKHVTTLLLYITLLLVSPPLVTAQYLRYSIAPSNLVGIMLAIAIVLVIIMFVVLNLCCNFQVARPVRANDGAGLRSSKGLESFPVFTYSEVAVDRTQSDPLECTVCFSPFEPHEKLRLLPKCNHVFHVDCLDPWLMDHSTCPLCRVDLLPGSSELDRNGPGPADEPQGEVNEGAADANVVEVRGDIEEGHIGNQKRCTSTGQVAESERL
ncbi:RING-H2 finger protein ATL32 [Bienertia sinuspersici]